MKRILSLLLSAVLAVTSLLALPITSSAAAPVTSINLKSEHQTMNGFGASACWWAKDVGGWENLDDIIKLLYDSEDGIGLNIYRYNLGAGSDKNERENTLHYSGDRWTESFLEDDGVTYNFDKDANAQKALAAARKIVGDDLRVTLFCNSAPVFMTKNGLGIGNDYWWDSNLDSSQYGNFADYCYNCVDYFQNKGYRITDISPMNEANGHWCRYNDYNEETDETIYYDWAGQEGCYYSAENARDLAVTLCNKLNGSPVAERGCKLTVYEATDMMTQPYNDHVNEWYRNDHYLNVILKNNFIKSNVDTITMHSYWTSREAKLEAAKFLRENYKKYSLAQTEYCQMGMDETSGVYDLVKDNMTSGLGIDYGVALANIILDDLTILDAVEWDWWTAVAYGDYTDGLVYVDKDTHKVETSKRLYALGNFSKFTEEGSKRIDAASSSAALSTVAFKNPDGTVSIVFVNNTDTEQQTALEFKGLSGNCYDFRTYVTDDTRNLEQYQSRSASTGSTVTIPAKSVTTVVVNSCNHSYDSGKITTPATCTEIGTKAFTCTICGDIRTEAVEAKGHNYSVLPDKAPTCTENGESASVCTVCGDKITTGTTAANGHKPVTIPGKAATCAQEGLTSGTKCSVCNEIIKPQEKIAKKSHKIVIDKAVAPTYKKEGKTEGKHCKVCGEVIVKQKSVAKKKLKAPSVSSIKAGKKAFTLKWKKVSDAAGYEIQYSTSKSFKSAKTVKVKGAKTTSKTVKKLKKGKTYYVRIKAYRSDAKSSWSKTYKVKIK